MKKKCETLVNLIWKVYILERIESRVDYIRFRSWCIFGNNKRPNYVNLLKLNHLNFIFFKYFKFVQLVITGVIGIANKLSFSLETPCSINFKNDIDSAAKPIFYKI